MPVAAVVKIIKAASMPIKVLMFCLDFHSDFIKSKDAIEVMYAKTRNKAVRQKNNFGLLKIVKLAKIQSPTMKIEVFWFSILLFIAAVAIGFFSLLNNVNSIAPEAQIIE